MNLAVARSKLVTRHFNFPSPATKFTFTNSAPIPHCINTYTTQANKNEGTSGDLWSDLVKNPLQWYDYRLHKVNNVVASRHPDFKRKETNEVLWLNSIPPSVLPGFENLEFDVKEVKIDVKEVARREDLWKSLLDEPTKWWDNRLKKKNPKGPDFTHKEIKDAALWVGSAPSWAVPELEKLQFFGKKGDKVDDDLWKTLLEDPTKWWDNRVKKMNPKGPDFTHKEIKGAALWVGSAPTWVLPELEKLQFLVKKGGKVDDDLWKTLLEDPSKWWDNRVKKLTPKAPDFKHKEIKDAALWIGSAPTWVLPELEKLEFLVKKGDKVDDDLWKTLLEDPTKWWDNRVKKMNPKGPDFTHKEIKGAALWVGSAPSWVLPELEKLQFLVKKVGKGNDDLWKTLLEDPSKWWDNRVKKLNPKAPDFTHKEIKDAALWVGSAPSWVLLELEKLQFVGRKDAKGDDLWKTLLEDPSKWWDNRVGKKNPKGPDFTHTEIKDAALWVGSAPTWVLPKLEKLEFFGKKGANVDDLWKTLLEDPSKWLDIRVGKKNPKAPDFKYMKTGEALWINSAPTWVLPELENLGSVQSGR